jgi:hypothetical protein
MTNFKMKCNRRNFLLASITSVLAGLNSFGKHAKSNPSQQGTVGGKNVSSTETSSSVDLSLLLHCIAVVETGNDDSKVGPKGERSRYQISKVVWNQHRGFLVPSAVSEHDFRTYCKGNEAQVVATWHLKWLDRHLPRISITEHDFRHFALAWAWRGGLSSWENQDKPYHVPTEKRVEYNNYATRVTNLYADLHGKPRPE